MLNDLITSNSVLLNPGQVVNWARDLPYYTCDDHPEDQHPGHWPGLRTLELLSHYDQEGRYSGLLTHMIKTSLDSWWSGSISQLTFTWRASMFFHQQLEHSPPHEEVIHTDPRSALAGVLYLSPQAAPDSGTVIYRQGQAYHAPNVFNSMVIYRSDYSHGYQKGFGQDIDNSRLTLTFFIRELNLSIKN
jgi:hypothetical protein